MVLKNIGLICPSCDGPGLHYNCDVEKDKRNPAIPDKQKRRMCVCFYTVHPYLSKEQLTPPTQTVITTPVLSALGAISQNQGNVKPDLRAASAAT